jgi:hypothetical protein
MTNYVVSTVVNGSFEVTAGATNTATSLVLLGRGTPGYGQIVASNTILQLENFAGPTAPTAPLIGQLWYDSGHLTINYYNGTVWEAVAQEADLVANYARLTDFTTLQTQVASLIANSATSAGTAATYVSKIQLYNPPAGTPVIPIAAGGTGLQTIPAGQLLVGNGNGPLVSIPTGAANFVLTMTAGGGYTWTDPKLVVPTDTTFMHTNVTNVPTADIAFNLGSASARYANVYAQTFQGTATSANYADLAERYEADCVLEAGDVVTLGGTKEITKSSSAFSTDVFGVVSTAPAYMMNSAAGDDTTHPFIALTGRVPVKVIGKVRKGQRIVSSSVAGVAQAAELGDIENSFVVIGRAVTDKTTDEVGLLEITVGAK